MMNEFSEELISAYLDGELTAEEQLRVEQALAQSAELRQTLEGMRSLSQTLQMLPRREPATDWSDGVLARASQAPARGATPTDGSHDTNVPPQQLITPAALAQKPAAAEVLRWRWLWPVAAAAAALAIVLFRPWQDGKPFPTREPMAERPAERTTDARPETDGTFELKIDQQQPRTADLAVNLGETDDPADVLPGVDAAASFGAQVDRNATTDEPLAPRVEAMSVDTASNGAMLADKLSMLDQDGVWTLRLAAPSTGGTQAVEQILARHNIRLLASDRQIEDWATVPNDNRPGAMGGGGFGGGAKEAQDVEEKDAGKVEEKDTEKVDQEPARSVGGDGEPVARFGLEALAGRVSTESLRELQEQADLVPEADMYFVESDSDAINGIVDDLQKAGAQWMELERGESAADGDISASSGLAGDTTTRFREQMEQPPADANGEAEPASAPSAGAVEPTQAPAAIQSLSEPASPSADTRQSDVERAADRAIPTEAETDAADEKRYSKEPASAAQPDEGRSDPAPDASLVSGTAWRFRGGKSLGTLYKTPNAQPASGMSRGRREGSANEENRSLRMERQEDEGDPDPMHRVQAGVSQRAAVADAPGGSRGAAVGGLGLTRAKRRAAVTTGQRVKLLVIVDANAPRPAAEPGAAATAQDAASESDGPESRASETRASETKAPEKKANEKAENEVPADGPAP